MLSDPAAMPAPAAIGRQVPSTPHPTLTDREPVAAEEGPLRSQVSRACGPCSPIGLDV